MSEYSIRELEKLSGIKAHTIRIWEKRYNLVCPKRTSTNIRCYSDDDLKKLLNISVLNKHGVKISKIANLRNDELTNQVNAVIRESWSYETQIENMLLAMLDFDEKKFEKVLSKSIIQMGFEDAMINVVNPFLIRIGLLWQTGSINPAHEHFISNLLRQKILVAIDGVMLQENDNIKKVIIFLPEGELHEIALLFAYFIVKRRGHKALYLGQSTPLNDVIEVYNKYQADLLITYFTSSVKENDYISKVSEMSNAFCNAKLIIAGNQSEILESLKLNNVERIIHPKELISLIENN